MAAQDRIALLSAVLATVVLGGPAQAALLGRAPLTSGGTDYQAYYDNALNITWTADANLAATESFGLPRNAIYPDVNGNNSIDTGELGPQGEMNWYTAFIWTDAMNSAAYLGQTGWRLPTIRPVNGVSFNSLDSQVGETDNGRNISAAGTLYAGSTAHEMANLFYNTLGNVAGYYPAGLGGQCLTFPVNGGVQIIPSCFQNPGPFANLLQTFYWEGLAWSETDAWIFHWREGYQGIWWKNSAAMDAPVPPDTNYYVHAWAVIDGDPLAVVPVPSALWLFGSALGVMGWMRRKVIELQVE
ncbi:MAG: PEP-CTERM sorting domain-containing protein [Gammaproteobacteria bacterium]